MSEVPTQFDVPPDSEPRRFSTTQLDRVRDYFTIEVEEAFSAQYAWEAEARDALSMYEGRPDRPIRDTPIPNAPNIEVPLGAIAADAIYAEAVDLIFQISPVVTARAVNEQWVKHAKALQRFINWGIDNEWNLRMAVTHTLCDDAQLGTGVYYIPWLEQIHKSMTGSTIQRSGPRIRSFAPENFLTPGSAPESLDDARWISGRFFFTPAELSVRSKYLKWDIEGAKAVGYGDSVRLMRERFARTRRTGEESRHLVETLEAYMYFDIDDDGIPEDLLVTMDRVSRKIFRCQMNPFDRRRPYEAMVYQPRAHMFKGIGLLKMLRELESSASEIHNQRVLNMLLANCRVWARKDGTATDTEEIWPGKQIMLSNPREDLVPLQMADVYTSSIQAETILAQYAERRTGVGDLGQGRSSSLGSRTPGITALSAMQSVNKRFTPAFDATRIATARAVQQCLYRYQERVKAGDVDVQTKLVRLLGQEDGPLVIDLLRQDDFDDGILVELTASSASVNRESDRQNAIMLVNVLGQYYGQVYQLMQAIMTPGIPPQLQAVGMKIVDAASEAIDRTLRTFDQIRDPEQFLIRVADVAQAGGLGGGADMGQLVGMLTQASAQNAAAAGANGNGGPPEGPVQ